MIIIEQSNHPRNDKIEPIEGLRMRKCVYRFWLHHTLHQQQQQQNQYHTIHKSIYHTISQFNSICYSIFHHIDLNRFAFWFYHLMEKSYLTTESIRRDWISFGHIDIKYRIHSIHYFSKQKEDKKWLLFFLIKLCIFFR